MLKRVHNYSLKYNGKTYEEMIVTDSIDDDVSYILSYASKISGLKFTDLENQRKELTEFLHSGNGAFNLKLISYDGEESLFYVENKY